MRIHKKSLILTFILCICFTMTGCNKLRTAKIKLGLKNNNFEYMRLNKVKQLVIQSTRDKGFRFVVTNNDVIKEAYDILSSAKKANGKSYLESDYIFEIHEKNGEVHRFNYVAGLDKKEGGNLYDDKNVYVVSSRLDNDILNNFENIRKPRAFKNVYYKSILDTIGKYMDSNKDLANKKIGLNLKDDIDIQKFILSSDVEEFKNSLKEKFPMIELTEKTEDCDIIISVDTEGYKSIVYKSIIEFSYKKTNTKPKKYYVWGKYSNRNWKIDIYDDKKPKDF
ncbi:hypothetical protein ACOAKC_03395 [Hathewaya histolytica]|uniref:hypothetical protein n=1 Tax=Hathewaya histolytica TaxID=1498 RepID=UPI003B67B68C